MKKLKSFWKYEEKITALLFNDKYNIPKESVQKER